MNLFPLEMPVDNFCMGRFLKNAEGGEVYVCTKGTPANEMTKEANFLTVYREEHGENVPVQQPIILNQVGLPVVDGEVVSILCPQEYALAVYDAYGEQQFYFPNVERYSFEQNSREQWRRSLAEAGLTLVSGSFEEGATVTKATDAVWHIAGGQCYTWGGALPKTVPTGSTPDSTGGVSVGSWNDVGEQSTLAVLAQIGGAEKIGIEQGGTVQDAILYKTVEMFDAVGDGVFDDSASLQAALNWVTAGPYRKLIFSSGKKYRHSVPLVATFNASASKFCHIYMQGALYPDPGVGDALTIQEATYCFFDLNIVGDGINIATIPDYSQADPTGCQQAVVINSCRACRVYVNAHSYAGRVLRTKGTGKVKLSFLDIQIRTGEGSCGQAAYLQATSDAFGRISHAQTQWDYFGSVLDKLTDVTITYWEYGSKNSAVPALLINDCGSLDGSNITGGSTWDADTSTTLKIVNGQGLHFARLQVGEAYHGLVIEGAGTIDDKPTVVVDYLLSYKTHDAATLNNTTGVQIKSGLCDNTQNGVVYKGNIYNCRVNMDGRNNFTAMHFADVGANIQSLTIGGGMYTDTSAHFVSMLNATVGKLLVSDTNVRTLGRYLFLPAANECVAIGGKWEGTNNASPIANRPKYIANISGIKTKYLSTSLGFASGSAQGTTITINHGLWDTPFDISITPYNVAAGTAFSTGNIVLKTLNSNQVVLMYTGSTELSDGMHLVVELNAESRPD